MTLVLKSFFVFVLCLGCNSLPTVEKKEYFHQLHSQKRVDHYHWMKDVSRKNPEVVQHLGSENKYTDSFLNSTLELQKNLYTEFLSRVDEADSEAPYFHRGYFYYSRTEKDKGYRIYCRRFKDMGAEEVVILDMNSLAINIKNPSLGSIEISEDQSIVAYTVDESGTEKYSLYFRDLNQPKLAVKAVENISPSFVWASDNRTVFFVRHNKAFRQNKIFRFQLGGNEEHLVYQEKNELFDVSLGKSADEKYLFINANSYVGDEVYFLNSDDPTGQWRVVQPRIEGLEYSLEHNDGYFYILNNRDSINFRISRASINKTSAESWFDYISHNPKKLITEILMQKKRLIYKSRENGQSEIRFVELKSGSHGVVPLDGTAYRVGFGVNQDWEANFVRLNFESPILPPVTYDFKFENSELEVVKSTSFENYNPSLYFTKRIFVQGRDGAEIPVTLVYKKGFDKNGKAPALLTGYGAYGKTMEPYFRPQIISLLDRGFLYAIAHIRGGQAKGRLWYEDGRLLNKENSFHDFIDVARGLIGGDFTSSEKLAISGRSAGGLLMGAVVNKRPDLFKAVVAQVPFVDVLTTLSDTSLRYSIQEYQQWGDPNQKVAYDYILSYSPYDNVEKQIYPSIFTTAGFYDNRVNYWEPSKWIAKVREKTQGEAPILLRTNMNGGHRGTRGRYAQLREEAEIYGYLLKVLGEAQ